MTEELLTAEIADEDLPDARKKRLQEKIQEKEEPKEERGATEYFILRSLDPLESPNRWVECGRSSGSSGRAALHALADSLGEGTYIAVPSRSWQPMTIAVETKIRIT